MHQYLKSTLLVAGIAAAAAFTPATAAAPQALLPFVKTITANPQGFSVEVGQNANEESVHFSVRNHSGNRLRCTLKAPDGSILETVYLKAKTGETTRNYLFESADEGTYSIEVTDGKDKIVKKIDLHRVKTIAKTEFIIQ